MELNLTIKEIKQLLGEGDSTLDEDIVVRRLSSLSSAQKDDMAILLDRGDGSVFDDVSSDVISQSHACLILAKNPVVAQKNYLIVKDPLAAFTKLVAAMRSSDNVMIGHAQRVAVEPLDSTPAFYVHPSSVIGKDVRIGNGSSIGAQVFIGSHVSLGENVIINPGAVIFDYCEIGDGTIVHSHAVIGADGFGYRVSKVGLDKIPHIGSVKIGKEVEIGAQCTVMRATFDQTVIEDRVKLDCAVHVAHNVKIGYGTAILAHTIVGGSAIIGRGCQIGGHVAIKDHVTVGDRVKIVSKCAVGADVQSDQVIAGIPAMPFSTWKRLTVLLSKLPEFAKTLREIQEMATSMQNKKGFFRRLFFRS